MAQIDNVKARNITETALIKQGSGALYGFIVNSHTSGTMKLVDGLSNGVAASGTLTSSGAMVAASHAESVVTGNAVVAGNVVVIGTITYTAVATLTGAAYEVLLGADTAAFLDNLKSAINGTTGLGTTYGFNTVAHPYVYATTNTDTTQKVVARLPGVSANTLATTGTALRTVWADTTLGGGTGNSNPGVTTAGATVTIGVNTYTAVIELSETSGADSVANEVLWVTSEAVFLDNLKSAINRTGTPGVDYSTATEAHPQVFATTNAATTQVVVARQVGTGGNAIATTETLANYAWGAATLASGTLTDGAVLANTYTFAAGSSEHIFPQGISFTTGLLAVIAGTAADVTLLVA